MLDHDAEFLDEHVFCVGGLEDGALEGGETRHEGEVHAVYGIVERGEGFEEGGAEVLFESKEEEGFVDVQKGVAGADCHCFDDGASAED